jgi:hypothetical protein
MSGGMSDRARGPGDLKGRIGNVKWTGIACVWNCHFVGVAGKVKAKGKGMTEASFSTAADGHGLTVDAAPRGWRVGRSASSRNCNLHGLFQWPGLARHFLTLTLTSRLEESGRRFRSPLQAIVSEWGSEGSRYWRTLPDQKRVGTENELIACHVVE